jgi:DNA-3-methyladenine glycosylase I
MYFWLEQNTVLMSLSTTPASCSWPSNDPLMIRYHDEEWGVPLHDDRKLFEFMVLDAFQAGLSWKTVLYKRENFRKALDNFVPEIIAGYAEEKIQRLLEDAGIIRNRAKIRGTVENAKAFLCIQKEFGSFDSYIWQFTGGKTKVNRLQKLSDIPATSPESDAMSKDLKKRGFKFVGSTICYAFMQAAGMVNDHIESCFRHELFR